jgi:hypothetical protein
MSIADDLAKLEDLRRRSKVIFPLFGVLFIGAAVGFGIYAYNRGQRYQQAYQAYQRRRRNVRPESFQ